MTLDKNFELNSTSREAVIAMETRDHLSNGVSLKDQMSRENINNKVRIKKYSFFLMLAALIISAAFVACNKDNDNKDDGNNGNEIVDNPAIIEVKDVVNGNNEIVTVKVFGNYEENEIASAKYNNGFKLNLPTIVPNHLMSENMAEDATISDMEARLEYFLNIVAYNANDEFIGSIDCRDDSNKNKCYYAYADRDFTLKRGDLLDYSFKKGWNKWYRVEREDGSYFQTTQKPSGIDFKWYYSPKN